MNVTTWATPTRAAGLERLSRFLPHAAAYASERNFDRPGHPNVSRLSPWIRHRLLREEEVVRRVLDRYPYRAVEKFVQEVLWRTYWKGWLELRPSVWTSYLEQVAQDRASLGSVALEELARAEAGETGIECFDQWVEELTTTGYLHNHARMWFASIWIFTLRLPWSLGASFFLRHLLDGDPASNTLSWRWVAGLQTRGKHYLARPENIAKFTEGRFKPRGLVQDAPPLPAEEVVPAGELPPSASPTAGARCGLLLTPADLTPEVSRLGSWPVSSVAAGWDREVGELLELDPEVVAFKRLALADGLARARQHFACPGLELDPVLDWVEAVRRWAAEAELEEVLTLEAPVGPWRAALERLAPALAEDGRRLVRVRRDWDDALWPRATRGFFAFKRDLEATVLELCRGGSSREGA